MKGKVYGIVAIVFVAFLAAGCSTNRTANSPTPKSQVPPVQTSSSTASTTSKQTHPSSSSVGEPNVQTDSISTPDKIDIYANGSQKEITKNADPFDQKLFDNINRLIMARIPQNISVAQSLLSKSDLENLKEFAVEFKYNNPQTVTVNNGDEIKIQYNDIVFPLSGKWENAAFIKETNNTYLPVGLNEDLNYLVRDAVK
ncbi:MAG: hypothetical protein M0Z55_00380 [Peptococcaceae bacterium]|nr:hypothetical protein [Peptococcaceae bacterium]